MQLFPQHPQGESEGEKEKPPAWGEPAEPPLAKTLPWKLWLPAEAPIPIPTCQDAPSPSTGKMGELKRLGPGLAASELLPLGCAGSDVLC